MLCGLARARRPEHADAKERVYLAYCAWCRSVGEDVLTRNAFNARLRIHSFEDKTAKMPGSGKAQKCWLNLTLKGGTEEA